MRPLVHSANANFEHQRAQEILILGSKGVRTMFRRTLLIMMLSVLTCAVANAQATKTQCANVALPGGWVPIAFSTNYSCGGGVNNQVTIENISTLSSGAQMGMCNGWGTGIIPAGWVIKNFDINTSCGSGTNNVWVIYNTNGLPTSSTVAVCAVSPVPSGWVYTQSMSGYYCNTVNYALFTILNTNGLPVGTRVNVCTNSPIPLGWAQVGSASSTRCTNGYIDIIQRNS
jgi:hypothetical protein